MKISFLPCTAMALALCLVLTLPALSQSGGYGGIGPSKGEIVGIIAGAGAALGAIGYLVYHETHKHPTVTGCIASNADGFVLTNEKDKRIYVLSGNVEALKASERVSLKGKKIKDSTGKFSFQIEKLTKDLGPCQP